MIKRIRFAGRRADLPAADFPAAWRQCLAASAAAPPGARPDRAAVCFPVAELAGERPRHDAVGIEWFADPDQLARFERWLAGSEGARARAAADRALDPASSAVLAATEHVLRGADWLAERLRGGGPKLKHMALAVRAAGLGAAEFAERWRGHAGTVGGSSGAQAVVIPDHVRGHAYVQNHPLPDAAADPWYDAVNEVYFDRLVDLRARIAWFDANLRDQTDDLFGQSWFLPVTEEILAH